MQTLEHNQITYNQLKPYIDSHQDCCVVNPCGSGKSSIIEAIVSDYGNSNILIVTKQANASNYYRTKSKVFRKSSVPIITYNTLYNCFKNDNIDRFENIDICIFDEAHYIGAQKWSMAVEQLREISGCVSIGVTATPQRFEDQGTERSIIDTFDKNCVGNYTVKQLQRQGIFIEPEYIVSLATLDKEIDKRLEWLSDAEISDEKKKTYICKLESAKKIWENECQPSLVMKKVLPKYLYRKQGNKILVFSKNTDAIAQNKLFIMNILHNQFPDKKIQAYEYSYKTSEKEFKEFLSDKTNYINVLFSVNKVCETIHISDLNILIFLRGSVSNRIITQQIGRINDVNNRHKSLIIDMVDNLSRYGSVQNENAGEFEVIQKDNRKPNLNYNLKYVNRIIHIFDDIDRISSGATYYQYNGFRGTLKQICYVFRRNFASVSKLLGEGHDLHDAMSLTPRNKRNYMDDNKYIMCMDYIPKEVLNLNDFDFVLSEEERKLVEKYNKIVYDIAELRHCKDEDIISDCQLYLCKVIHDFMNQPHDKNISESAHIYNKISQFMLQDIKRKNDETNLVENLDEDYACDMEMPIIEKIDREDMEIQLPNLLHTLPNRNTIIIMLRYGLDLLAHEFIIKDYNEKEQTIEEYTGFDFHGSKTCREIGELYHLTPNRITQIEAKALRMLRSRIYRKDLLNGKMRFEKLVGYQNEYLENQ